MEPEGATRFRPMARAAVAAGGGRTADGSASRPRPRSQRRRTIAAAGAVLEQLMAQLRVHRGGRGAVHLMRTVAIAGTGLIGASFGLALAQGGIRRRNFGRQLGTRHRGSARNESNRSRSAPGRSLGGGGPDLSRPAHRADCRHAPPSGCDGQAGSPGNGRGQHETRNCGRRPAASHALRISGRHPMAGKERRGAREAEADLSAGRSGC